MKKKKFDIEKFRKELKFLVEHQNPIDYHDYVDMADHILSWSVNFAAQLAPQNDIERKIYWKKVTAAFKTHLETELKRRKVI